MDLIDRYLQAVRRFLPVSARDDIASELADDIHSEMKDQEAHLGRPMTEDEVSGMLTMRGHPFLLAQRYRTRYVLIGPSLVPFYWQTLKAALALAFLVIVIITAVFAANGAPPTELLRRLAGFFDVAIYVFAWVTIFFAGLDMAQARLHLFDTWNPRTLPALTPERDKGPGASFAELVGAGVFLIWWLAVPHYPWIMLGPAASLFAFSSAWHTLYVPATVPIVVSLLLQVVVLVRPQWTWLGRSRRLITNLLSVGAILLLLGAGDLVVAVGGSPVDAHALALVNKGVTLSLTVTLLVLGIQVGLDARRLVRLRGQTL